MLLQVQGQPPTLLLHPHGEQVPARVTGYLVVHGHHARREVGAAEHPSPWAASFGLPGRSPAVQLGVGVLAVLLAALALFATLLDQGQLLSPVLGDAARSVNYLHELGHDGRHLLGAPCH